ncbi:MAG: hypothetical protein H6779_00930 [Candidatus Nomurabacteria bacterium]|nr:hypothetical protein [Candidatus Nomurabacteria bacterium]USN87994.1 MAG: hypothetical protein H6779_00930 [Candidatus Nomurabacteria bacterium]
MQKFILLIKGGSPDDSNREEIMDQWKTWVDDLRGKGILDSMGPFEEKGKDIIGTDMSVSDYQAEVGGYLVVNADDMDAAVEIAKGSPSLTLGGSVGVHAVQEMGL